MLVESLAVSGEGPGRMVRVTMAGMGPSGERRKATEVSSVVLTFHPALRQLGVRWVPISKVGRLQHPQGHSVHGGAPSAPGAGLRLAATSGAAAFYPHFTYKATEASEVRKSRAGPESGLWASEPTLSRCHPTTWDSG